MRQEHACWLRAVVRASAHALAVMMLVTISVFLLMRLLPGDPALMILGTHASDEKIAIIHAQLGLDEPLWRQAWLFLVGIITRGDTGESIAFETSCRSLLLARLPVTLSLIVFSGVLIMVVTVLVSSLAAWHKDSWFDHLVRVMSTTSMAIPMVITGLLLIAFFSLHLGWLPVGGADVGDDGFASGLILPAVTLTLYHAPLLIRSLREHMVSIMGQPFVLALCAKGSSDLRVTWHVMRNAVLPALHLFGMQIAYLLGGTIVVEQLFALRGVGTLLLSAINARDFPLVQLIALYSAFAVVIVSLLVDVMSALLDARVADVDQA